MTTTEPVARDEQWELNHLHVLMYDAIGMCGCGWGDDAYDLVRDLLDHFHDRDDRNIVEMVGSAAAAQIVLYRIQSADLIDHGTSVTSSWMTDKGRYARWLMHKHPRLVEYAGYPDCWDNERGACPNECWTPTDDVPPEPERPSMDELVERARQEAAEIRARMNPVQRAIWDEADAIVENVMLYGQHPAPDRRPSDYTGLLAQFEPPALGYILPPGNSAEGEALWNEMLYGAPPKPLPPGSSTHTGLFDALGAVTPGSVEWPAGIEAGSWSTVRSDEIAPPDPGYVGRLQRSQVPQRSTASSGGRNPYTECRRVDATWIHGGPDHTCPPHARG